MNNLILLKNLLTMTAMVTFSHCASFGGSVEDEHRELYESSPQYQDGIFVNKVETPVYTVNKLTVYWNFFFGGADDKEPDVEISVQKINPEDLYNGPETDLRLTWLGHSSFLIEMSGRKILIDSVFSDRTSPLSWAGPKRWHENPISIRDLPAIDIVVISHDHYDHLDYESIVSLKEKVSFFIVPLGVDAHLRKWGVKPEKIIDLDWHQKVKLGEVTFISTPARHFSGRNIFGENKTLWSSWVIRSPTRNLYFSGDTGPMNDEFSAIGKQYGPFDYTLMQLGCYGKDWPFIHMTPEEAVTAHEHLRGKIFMSAHWGTFALALHSWREPIERAMVALRNKGIETLTPMPGEMLELGETMNHPMTKTVLQQEKTVNE